MRCLIVLALVFCYVYGNIRNKIGPVSYHGNCDTYTDCPQFPKQVCMLPGFGSANANAQKKCYLCECMYRYQCKLEKRKMTCDCTGYGYTGVNCNTRESPICNQVDPCDLDGARASYNLTATSTTQILTSPGFPTFYCRDMEFYWRIYAPDGKRIRITVTYMASEPYDDVEIYDDECTQPSDCNLSADFLLADLGGNADPLLECRDDIFYLQYNSGLADLISDPFESSSNVVTIFWRSEIFNDRGPGWSLNYIYID